MNIDYNNIPEHIAIIMDGNRRWAKKRGLPKVMGHREGAKTLKAIVEDANKIGIRHLTVYAFSTENWKREQKEIDALMNLLHEFLDECSKNFADGKYVVNFIGDCTKLSSDLVEKIEYVKEKTKENNGTTLHIALNYGGKDEIVRSIKKIAERIENGEINSKDINEELFNNYLDTAGIPEPELIIRTSGEQRLSNFLLWQAAYSEFYFCEKMWPDFKKKDLEVAIASLQNRNRRFGGV